MRLPGRKARLTRRERALARARRVRIPVFLLLGAFFWLLMRRRGRLCSSCGDRTGRGDRFCQRCGHDLAAPTARNTPINRPMGSGESTGDNESLTLAQPPL